MAEETGTGTVKFFNVAKQFGFINGDDGKSYFFHASAVEGGIQLNEGDKVSFKVTESEKGPRAENVKKVAEGGEAQEEEKKEEAAAEESESEEQEAGEENAEEAPAEESESEEEKKEE
jgi:CspA family cold shock protein